MARCALHPFEDELGKLVMAAAEDTIPKQHVLRHLADSRHPLNGPSVELVSECVLQASTIASPSAAIAAVFAVFGPLCSSLTIRGHFKYHPEWFSRISHVLKSCQSLKKLRVDGHGKGDNFHLRAWLLSQTYLEELEILRSGSLHLAHVTNAVAAFEPGLNRQQIGVNLTRGAAPSRLFEASGSTLMSLQID